MSGASAPATAASDEKSLELQPERSLSGLKDAVSMTDTVSTRFHQSIVVRFSRLEQDLLRDVSSSPQLSELIRQLQAVAANVRTLPVPGLRGLPALSKALLCCIIEFLPIQDHVRARLVSRGVRAASRSPSSWPAHLYLHEPHPFAAPDESQGDSHERRPREFWESHNAFNAGLNRELSGRVTAITVVDQADSSWAPIIIELAWSLTALQCPALPNSEPENFELLRSLRLSLSSPVLSLETDRLPGLESLAVCSDLTELPWILGFTGLRHLTLSLLLHTYFQRAELSGMGADELPRLLQPLKQLPEMQTLSLLVRHADTAKSFRAVSGMLAQAAHLLTSLVVETMPASSRHERHRTQAAPAELAAAASRGDELLSALGACPRLQRLVLFRVHFTEKGLQALLGGAKALRAVSLWHSSNHLGMAGSDEATADSLQLLLRHLPDRVTVRVQARWLGVWLVDRVFECKCDGKDDEQKAGDFLPDAAAWRVRDSAAAAWQAVDCARLTAAGSLAWIAERSRYGPPAVDALRRLRRARFDPDDADFVSVMSGPSG